MCAHQCCSKTLYCLVLRLTRCPVSYWRSCELAYSLRPLTVFVLAPERELSVHIRDKHVWASRRREVPDAGVCR